MSTTSVAMGDGHSTWGGGWTTGPGRAFSWPNGVLLDDPVQIAGGSDGTAFVLPDHTLYVCGLNWMGTPGQGYIAIPAQPVTIPQRVTGGIPLYPAERWTVPGVVGDYVRQEGPVGPVIDGHVIAVAGCGTNLFALLDDGRVTGWGGNAYGPLGNGYYGSTLEGIYGGGNQVVETMHKDEEEGHYFPQLAPGYVLTSGPPMRGTPLEGVVFMAVGHGVALFRTSDGRVWFTGWLGGMHSHPQAESELYARPLPEPIQAKVEGCIALTCQHQTCIALMPDGSAKAFGTNQLGTFGNGKVKREEGGGTKVGTVESAPGVPLWGIKAISGSEYHSVFLLEDGTVACCGRDIRGECGQGSFSPPGAAYRRPVRVKGLGPPDTPRVVAIAAAGEPEFGETTIGSPYTQALLEDGTMRGWGGNAEGQLGDLSAEDRATPVRVSGLAGVKGIAAASTSAKAIIEGSSEAPTLTAEPAVRNGVAGVLVKWTLPGLPALMRPPLGWYVKHRLADPLPLTEAQAAAGWYRVYGQKWKSSKVLPSDAREYFFPLEVEPWSDESPPHYSRTRYEITVSEAIERPRITPAVEERFAGHPLRAKLAFTTGYLERAWRTRHRRREMFIPPQEAERVHRGEIAEADAKQEHEPWNESRDIPAVGGLKTYSQVVDVTPFSTKGISGKYGIPEVLVSEQIEAQVIGCYSGAFQQRTIELDAG